MKAFIGLLILYKAYERFSWKTLPNSYKQQFVDMAEKDKERYENEKSAIMEIERNETKKLKIYLSKSNGNIVGLDNGFSRYEIFRTKYILIK